MNNVTIDLGLLAQGPHATLIRQMAGQCAQDGAIQAIWIGGSLAAGQGDEYSDVDFRIAVEPGQVARWESPDWARYLPSRPCGGTLMRFGEQALLHHLILTNGTIVDFYVQDTAHQNPEPNVIILFCRDDAFREVLDGLARPAAPLEREIDGTVLRQFLVDYWITTHKQMKALARHYDHSPFVGLYFERIALLRAWYMEAVGQDINARVTLHMLGQLHLGLNDQLTEAQQSLLGLPSRTPQETVTVIEAIRTEMARVGRRLAARHAFDYPSELEAVVQRVWLAHREAITKR